MCTSAYIHLKAVQQTFYLCRLNVIVCYVYYISKIINYIKHSLNAFKSINNFSVIVVLKIVVMEMIIGLSESGVW